MRRDHFRSRIETEFGKHVPGGRENLSGLVTVPPPPKVSKSKGGARGARSATGHKVKLADLSLPCFKLASLFPGMKPPEIASHLESLVGEPPEGFSAMVANGPYLNFFYDHAELARIVLGDETNEEPEVRGLVLVEYSSPNIAKPFHVGHLRTTILGESLARMLESQGWEVVRINHLGDWGVQTGLQVMAWERWGDDAALEEGGIRYLCDLYVRINQEAKQDPTIGEEARKVFRRLEEGDRTVRAVWRRFVDMTRRELQDSYARLGIRFDRYDGESFYEPRVPQLLEEARSTGLMYESRGAQVVDVPGIEEPCILVKADGATIYQTRDVAAALFRWATWPGMTRCLYVVAANQEFHFRQVFGVFERMRPEAEGKLQHVKFGMVRDARGEIYSTRGGASARLDDILDEARDRALDLVREKSGPLPDEASVAEAVGHAAIAFDFLRRSPGRDLRFVFEEASRPDGDTGPYIQYTHARCCSIIAECGGEVPRDWDPSLLDGPEEVEVLKGILNLPDAVARGANPSRDVYDTSVLASALLDLARTFSSFYTAHGEPDGGHRFRYPVRDASPALRAARLRLVDGVRGALAEGLKLLTIEAPPRM